MDAVYLFDAESTLSILGVRTYNSFNAKFVGNKVIIGKNELEVPHDLKCKILPSAFGQAILTAIDAKVPSFFIIAQLPDNCVGSKSAKFFAALSLA